MLTKINNQYETETGVTNNGQTVTTLYKTHGKWDNGELFELSRKSYIKGWYFTPDVKDTEVTEADILKEIELNTWERWNKELPQGQKVEVSEAIYWDMLEALPPRKRNGNYFEVGEPHHHLNNGTPIHRACWIENNQYFTGYPTI